MGLLVLITRSTYTPKLEVETSDGTRYFIDSTEDGALVIKSDHEMFAELGKPYEVVVRQLKGEREEWQELAHS